MGRGLMQASACDSGGRDMAAIATWQVLQA